MPARSTVDRLVADRHAHAAAVGVEDDGIGAEAEIADGFDERPDEEQHALERDMLAEGHEPQLPVDGVRSTVRSNEDRRVVEPIRTAPAARLEFVAADDERDARFLGQATDRRGPRGVHIEIERRGRLGPDDELRPGANHLPAQPDIPVHDLGAVRLVVLD